MNGDVNCLLGHWPFRKLYKNTLQDLLDIHRTNGIETGYVSSLNAIFYNDPFEGDEELHAALQGTDYRHILTVHPGLPGWERDLDDGIERFGIAGVRVYPTYHGYSLNGPEMERLCRVLESRGLPLFLTVRLEDERLDYLIKPAPLSVQNDLIPFLGSHPDLTVLLLQLRYGEATAMKEAILSHPRAFFDTSGLKDGLFVIEKLLRQFPPDRLMYGSQYPLYCLKSTLLLVELAELDPEDKARILGGHRLFAAPGS
ncbi:hypothetical protein J31TS4_28050 [Paenibacillus sp. J31TS4]|uniref:amidohydrolase family protein n=1 Tax=Paenibacillus sp. J31TS4 TaxID=2807195 RepID=UPI001B1148B9|nr:amidohydrolase family protein [Paenibacillus sp. J31TS4]GIP39525.1 hypothetical protein J31TS4_28050 [Paenibacillus sp. J31TS4]